MITSLRWERRPATYLYQRVIASEDAISFARNDATASVPSGPPGSRQGQTRLLHVRFHAHRKILVYFLS